MTNTAYTGPERRSNPGPDDHETVVIMKRDMRYLCKMVQEIRNDVKKQADVCSCRMKDCNAFFVSQRVFYTALAALLLFMGTVGTVAYNNRTRVVAHERWSVEAQERINDRFNSFVIPDPPNTNPVDILQTPTQ